MHMHTRSALTDQAEDLLRDLRGTELFHVARAAVNATVPEGLPDTAVIYVADVRDLMALAFMRGATWRAQQH